MILLHYCTSSGDILKNITCFLITYDHREWFIRGVRGNKWFSVIIKSLIRFAIMCNWEILRVDLLSSRLIVHPENFSCWPIYLIIYYFLIYSILSINSGLSMIYSVAYKYKITIAVLSLFTVCKIQVPVLHGLNTAVRVVVLIYFLNQKCTSYTRP